MIAKQPAVKRYVVRLSEDEHEQLDGLIRLKVDASEAGASWNDSRIAEAPDSSVDTIARTRQQLIAGDLEAVLIRKHSPNSARRRIFDGAAEAKLIADLFCATQRAFAVDAKTAGSRRGGTQHRWSGQRQRHRADAQKNTLRTHLQRQWVIPPEANAAL